MGDAATFGREVLKRQLVAMTKNPPEGISVGLVDDEDMRPSGAGSGRGAAAAWG